MGEAGNRCATWTSATYWDGLGARETGRRLASDLRMGYSSQGKPRPLLRKLSSERRQSLILEVLDREDRAVPPGHAGQRGEPVVMAHHGQGSRGGGQLSGCCHCRCGWASCGCKPCTAPRSCTASIAWPGGASYSSRPAAVPTVLSKYFTSINYFSFHTYYFHFIGEEIDA